VYKTVSEHFSEAVVVNKYLNWLQNVNEKRRVIYLYLVLFHVLLDLLFIWFTAKLYVIPFFILGCYFVIKNQNRNNQTLMAAAYITGSKYYLG
jgi:hypothetical protein